MKLKIKESKQHLRARIRAELATKKFRAECIGRTIQQQREVADTPSLLEAYGEELKYLAYQIRNLKSAERAVRLA